MDQQMFDGSTKPSDKNEFLCDRTLASIVRVKKIYPIAGADLIVLAEIKGWRCVVKKDEFKEGDFGVYLAIDSIPDLSDPNTSFIKEKGGRIKTIKLRGVISQGLLGPLQWLESRGVDISTLKEDDDVTVQMGVTKYVPNEELVQYSKGVPGETIPFPITVRKTDEKRLQDNPAFLEDIKDRQIVITRKEDGCSCTIICDNGNFKICSRNYELLKPTTTSGHYFQVCEKFKLEEKMKALKLNIAIQGEIIGPKINANRLKQNAYSIRVFNVWDIDKQCYMNYSSVTSMCDSLGIDQVPLIFKGIYDPLRLNLDHFLELADLQEYTKGNPAEGIVVKTDDDGLRISFKVISNKYLLGHKL